MATLFISDLHLDASRPRITRLFLDFLHDEARSANALYVLGDLFEAWVGDDDPSEIGAQVAAGLHELVDSGVPVYFIRGNRDFLLGTGFAARAGMRILPDPAVVLVKNKPVLLMHGDLLCTADLAYQAFRRQTRDPQWQATFLAQPLQARLAFAEQARAASQAHQAGLREAGDDNRFETITDVDRGAVVDTFQRFGIDTLVHGHTHRPAVHELQVQGRACQRIVLGDWFEQGSVLRMEGGQSSLRGLGGPGS